MRQSSLRPIRRSVIALAAICGAAGFTTLLTAAPRAEKTERGITLVVPDGHISLGTVHYVHPGRDAQATFTSDAPLEHIKGTTSRVIGYAVWSGERGAEQVGGMVAGEFHLPVVSIDTGIPLRNEHLQDSRWLDAAAHPDIVFQIAESRDVKLTQKTEEFATYSVTLVGDMTIKGVTREISVPARVTLMAESERTRTRAPGDLMAVRCDFSVKLSDYGVTDQIVGSKLTDEIELDVALFLSTASPERARGGR